MASSLAREATRLDCLLEEATSGEDWRESYRAGELRRDDWRGIESYLIGEGFREDLRDRESYLAGEVWRDEAREEKYLAGEV